MKNLIVYFSHNKENYVSGNIVDLKEGNMKVIMTKLSGMIDADVFEIIPVNDYPRVYRECTDAAKREKNAGARPEIKNTVEHMEQYDCIYLGYPNWWGTMPMIVMTFLESYDFTGKHIYPVCTHEGSGMGSSERDLKKLCPSAVLHKGLAVYGSEAADCDQALRNWIKKG